ncbi:hypothetical protein DND132_2780 [Pseudodesulfovibrio mercurii]|uniref:RidA family protein n=1 Tax=Pseudodesulfovibrio mercurii TaxID=641491 RepID=F0JJ84_9BACT|nr:hypothetical protein [Pseudodesulfovibrio mercurii]EGB15983.1 hypothetical protein DND132_2780 [Pseudodesulfovibrio mercurii]
MTLRRANHPGRPDPLGPYGHAVRHNDTLYLSGLTAHGAPARSPVRVAGLFADGLRIGVETVLDVNG